MKKVLVIDDERMMTSMIKVILEDRGHSVTGFSNSMAGEHEAIKNNYDLIYLDLHMPERNGAEITKNILDVKPYSKIIIITAFPIDSLAEEALRAGALTLLEKPLDMTKILNSINTIKLEEEK